MKFSNREIVESLQKLSPISQKQLPVKVSYAIAKNITKLEAELRIYNKEREKLINKYSKKDEKGNVSADEAGQIIFKEECIGDWNKDIKELLEIEVDIDIHKFYLDQLEGTMSPAEIMNIEYMISE